MKHTFKRTMAFLLTMCMLVGLMPAGVFAAGGTQHAIKFIDSDTGYVYHSEVTDDTLMSFTAPAAPTKAGFTFGGWQYVSGAKTTDYIIVGTEYDTMTAGQSYYLSGDAGDTVYQTIWTADAAVSYGITWTGGANYTFTSGTGVVNSLAGKLVSFEITADDGFAVTDVAVTGASGDTLAALESVTQNSDGKYVYRYSFTMPAEAVTVSATAAKIELDWFAVRFENAEGSLYNLVFLEKAGNVKMPAGPAKAGSVFDGWQIDGTGTVYAQGTDVPVSGSVTFKPSYTADVYNVTYDEVGGTAVTDATAGYGDKITLAGAPTKADNAFIGWRDLSTGLVYGANATFEVKDDAAFEAVWKSIPPDGIYVATFINEDGLLYDFRIVPVDAWGHGEVHTPSAPVKAGYTFDGWDRTGALVAANDTDIISDHTTYTAKWTEIPTPDFSVNVAAGTNTKIDVSSDQTKAGTTVTVDVTVDNGYELDYVTINGAAAAVSAALASVTQNASSEYVYRYTFTMPAEDVTVATAATALEEEIYTVKFMDMDGTLYNILFEKGSASVVLPTAPAKAGLQFAGWNMVGGGFYTVPNTVTVTAATVFTASYTQDSYTFSYNSDGGSTTPSNDTAAYGDVVTLPAAVAKAGFDFIGWQDDATSLIYAAGAKFTAVGDASFTAVWKAAAGAAYTVKYIDDSGLLYEHATVTADAVTGQANIMTYSAPVKAGYTFMGWKDEGAGITVGAGVMTTISSSVVYKAVWNANPKATYTITKAADANTEINAAVSAEVGASVSFTVKVKEGFALDYVLVKGTALAVNAALASVAQAGNDWVYTYNFVMPDEAVTITAVSSPVDEEQYLVKFVDADGTLYNVMLASGAATLTMPGVPAKTGYDFSGWTLGGATYVPGTPVGVTGETVFTASFSPISYTVSYDANGGVTDPAPVNATYGQEITLADAVNKDGFRFMGWRDDKTSLVYAANATYAVMGTTNFTAVWEAVEPQTYLVKFVDGSGILYDYRTVAENSNILTAAAPAAAAGFSFGGWSDGINTVGAGSLYLVTNDVTFTAVWTAAAYNVSFDANGGTPTPAALSAGYNDDIVLPAAPTREGFAFIGWRDTRTSLVYGAGANYTVTQSVNMQAVWSEIAPAQYVVKFSDPDGYLYDYVTAEDGSKINAPAAPVKTGYTFGGWILGASTVASGGEITVTGDAVYEAVWNPTVHAISYDPAGGTPTPAAPGMINYGDTITLSNDTITRDGYIFVGWKDSMTGFVYSAGSNYVVTQATTFVAVWEEETPVIYSVKFVDENGIMYDYQTAIAGDGVTAPEAPTKEGYTFKYWSDGVNTVNASSTTPAVNADTVYTAVWEASKVYLSIDQKNATVSIADGYRTAGETVTFTIAEDTGYVITSVSLRYNNGIGTVSIPLTANASGEYTFTMPGADAWIFVVAEQQVFNITDGSSIYAPVTLTNPGSAVVNGKASVNDTVTFTVKAKDNYALKSVYVETDGGEYIPVTFISEEADGTQNYAFTMPAANVTIKTTAVENEYTVMLLDWDNAVIDILTVTYNQTVDLDAYAAARARVGYDFSRWVINNTTSEFISKVTAVTGNLVLYAEYKAHAHNISKGADSSDVVKSMLVVTENNSGATNSGDLMNPMVSAIESCTDANVTITVTPEERYVITGVAVRGVGGSMTAIALTLKSYDPATGACTYTFKMPAEDVEIAAYTEAIPYTVTVTETPEEGGTYTINGFVTDNLKVAQGDNVAVAVTPAAGYKITEVLATYTPNSGGTAYLVEERNVAYDAPTTFNFTMSGYDVNVAITYEKIDYSIDVVASNAASAGEGKVETQSGIYEAQIGDLVTLVATPEAGYHLDTLTATYAYNGGVESLTLTKIAENTYTFVMPAIDVTVTATFALDTYKVTADTDIEGGLVTIAGHKDSIVWFDYKDTVEFTATPDAGYYISRVAYEYNGTTVELYTGTQADIAAQTYSFEMPHYDVKLIVEFAKVDYNIDVTASNTASAGTGKVETESGAYLAQLGDIVTLVVTPEAGYQLASLTVTRNGAQESLLLTKVDDNKYTFTMPAENVVVTATFAEIVYKVTAETVIEGGKVTIAGHTNSIVEFAYKDTVEFTVTPDAGYYISRVAYEYNGTTVELYAGTQADIAAQTYSFEMPHYDVKLIVEFAKVDYNIDVTTSNTASAGTGKVETQNDVYLAQLGDIVTLVATPEAGYHLDTLTATYAYNGGVESLKLTKIAENTYTFVMPATEVTVTATFAVNTYKVTAETEIPGGNVTVDGHKDSIVWFDYKDTVEFTATPDAGYYISRVAYEYNGTTVELYAGTQADIAAQTYSFEMPHYDVKLIVEFAKVDYSIDVTTSNTATVDKGSVAASKDTANIGNQIILTVTPEYGYNLKSIVVTYVDGGETIVVPLTVTTENVFVFTMPAANVTVTAEFVKDQYTVLFRDYNGVLLDTQTVKYRENPSLNVTVPARDGYVFTGWTSADVETPVTTPSNTAADFVIVKNTVITANYETAEFSISYNTPENGTVTGPAAADFMDVVTFTATPETGYQIDKVTATYVDVNGEKQTITFTAVPADLKVGGDYTFVMPAGNVEISVSFRTIEYTVALNIEGKGTGTLNGDYTEIAKALYKDTVSVTLKAAEGYELESVTVNGAEATYETTADADTYTFTMPAEDVTVNVVFVKTVYQVTVDAAIENGTVASDKDSANIEDVITLTVTPDEGYNLANIYVVTASGEYIPLSVDNAGKYFFTMPAEDVTVHAAFAKNIYTVTFVDYNGKILKIEGVAFQEAATAPADPYRKGYTFDGWDVAFDSVTENLTVTATYKVINSEITSAVISATENGNGAIGITPEGAADYGETVTVVLTPDAGYRFKSISIKCADGSYISASFVSETVEHVATFTFTMPDCAVEVIAEFTEHSASNYTDIRTDDWYYEAIQFVSDLGYFKGIDEDIFAPHWNMTRAMFVTSFGRLAGIDPSQYTDAPAYTDVEEGMWYTAYIQWATEEGIVLGYGDGTFGPEDIITREQMALLMYKFIKWAGYDVEPQNSNWMNRYIDTDEISDWAKEAVEWSVGIGLMKGTSETTIAPKAPATRAEVAQLIKNFCDKVIYR